MAYLSVGLIMQRQWKIDRERAMGTEKGYFAWLHGLESICVYENMRRAWIRFICWKHWLSGKFSVPLWNFSNLKCWSFCHNFAHVTAYLNEFVEKSTSTTIPCEMNHNFMAFYAFALDSMTNRFLLMTFAMNNWLLSITILGACCCRCVCVCKKLITFIHRYLVIWLVFSTLNKSPLDF